VAEDKLHWQDSDDLGACLAGRYPQRDPLAVRFTELRELVEGLPEFEGQPGHHCNEAILEAIQAAWYERVRGGGKADV
jgi:FeS assembly protein IscX